MRFTTHRREKGERYHREACKKGWEGVIAKDAASAYAHSRSRKWLKFKCLREQELVIGGDTEPKGSRKGFGALIVGFYRGKTLHYAGKVGTGYDEKTLKSLSARLRKLEQEKCPFAEKEQAAEEGVHWVTPKRVTEIGFTEWTRDDRLRHPRYIGLRRDKSAKRVFKETPDTSAFQPVGTALAGIAPATRVASVVQRAPHVAWPTASATGPPPR